MSTYTLMSSEIPTLAYSVIQQETSELSEGDFLKRLKERNSKILAETNALDSALRKFLADTTIKESQTLRGMLSPFLQTPISSDDADVGEMLREALERYGDQILDPGHTGIKHMTVGKLIFPSFKKTREKKLLANGRLYLQELGFDVAGDKGELLETVFIVEGAKNLDVLEFLLKERMPPDMSMEDGVRIHRSQRTLQNLLYAGGNLAWKPQSQSRTEVSISFSRPDLKYASFRLGLMEGVQKLQEHFLPVHLSLWQRKLGLGAGREFELRVIAGSAEIALETLLWLETYKEHRFLKEAVIDHGCLLTRELLL